MQLLQDYVFSPFFATAQHAGGILISIVNQIEMARKDSDFVANKQIFKLQLFIFCAIQKSSTILHVILQGKDAGSSTSKSNSSSIFHLKHYTIDDSLFSELNLRSVFSMVLFRTGECPFHLYMESCRRSEEFHTDFAGRGKERGIQWPWLEHWVFPISTKQEATRFLGFLAFRITKDRLSTAVK